MTFIWNSTWPSKSRRSCRPNCITNSSACITTARHSLCAKRSKARPCRGMSTRQPRKGQERGSKPILKVQSQRKWYQHLKTSIISGLDHNNHSQNRAKLSKSTQKRSNSKISKKPAQSSRNKKWHQVRCWIIMAPTIIEVCLNSMWMPTFQWDYEIKELVFNIIERCLKLL